MPQNSPHVLVLAYSGRALAEAAKAAGLQTTVLDQFGDADTLLVADRYAQVDFASDFNSPTGNPFRQLEDLTSNTVRSSGGKIDHGREVCPNTDSNPLTAVLLGGGSENRPELIKQLNLLAANNSLAGVPGETASSQLRTVKFWQRASAIAGCHFPPTKQPSESTFTTSVSRADDAWLLKQADSAGGLGVRPISTLDQATAALGPGSYLQKRIPGKSIGATIVVGEQSTRVLGCTGSIDSHNWQPAKDNQGALSRSDPATGPSQFVYRGSLGPIDLPESHHETLIRIGDYCRQNNDWRGWLQIDFIEDCQGRLWMLEINPRWTAGMEVLRLSGLCNPVVEHLRAIDARGQETLSPNRVPGKLVAKAVYYAEHPVASDTINLAAREAEQELAPANKSAERIFRDVPSLGSATVLAGHPALTIVVCLPLPENTPPETQRKMLLDALQHARQTLQRRLARDGSPT